MEENVLDRNGIYVIVNTVNNKIYIGKTKNSLKLRWQQHVALARKGSRLPFHCAIRKYGPEVFQLHLLSSFPLNAGSPEEAYFISRYRAAETGLGYNVDLGGDGPTRVWTKEQRETQSEKLRQNNPMHNPACRAKMAETLSGRKLSLEHRRAIGKFMKDHNPSILPDVKLQRSKFLKEHNPGRLPENRMASSYRLSNMQKQPGYVYPARKPENRKKASERAKGTIWIHRGEEKKHIQPEELEVYHTAGWEKGLGTRSIRLVHSDAPKAPRC